MNGFTIDSDGWPRHIHECEECKWRPLMTTKIKETQTALLLGTLLRALMIGGHPQDVKANYTAKGSEAVVEFEGQFYRVIVEPYG